MPPIGGSAEQMYESKNQEMQMLSQKTDDSDHC